MHVLVCLYLCMFWYVYIYACFCMFMYIGAEASPKTVVGIVGLAHCKGIAAILTSPQYAFERVYDMYG